MERENEKKMKMKQATNMINIDKKRGKRKSNNGIQKEDSFQLQLYETDYGNIYTFIGFKTKKEWKQKKSKEKTKIKRNILERDKENRRSKNEWQRGKSL